MDLKGKMERLLYGIVDDESCIATTQAKLANRERRSRTLRLGAATAWNYPVPANIPYRPGLPLLAMVLDHENI